MNKPRPTPPRKTTAPAKTSTRPQTKARGKTLVKASPEPVATTPPAKLKHKLVRDSFTIPKHEYVVLDELKLRAAGLMRPVRKSELLRAGIAVLKAMPDKAFLAALNAVPSLKTGRPKAAAPAKGAD